MCELARRVAHALAVESAADEPEKRRTLDPRSSRHGRSEVVRAERLICERRRRSDGAPIDDSYICSWVGRADGKLQPCRRQKSEVPAEQLRALDGLAVVEVAA